MRAVVRSLEDLQAWIEKLAREGILTGKPLTVSIREFHRPRTLDQNAKLHAMFRDLAEHTGFTEGEIKDYFKSEFGPKMSIALPAYGQPGQPDPRIPKGTSRYTVQEMAAMLERVYQVGAECGCRFSDDEE